ncbi:hypothetical protein [Nannocystis pusilla]|uniref:hypothetical protein n=1 Tax=Nannocystis pusilla TaxID=889268 RepID=UPI003BF26F89
MTTQSHLSRILRAGCIGAVLLLGIACGDDEKPGTTTGVDDTSTTAMDGGGAEPADPEPPSTTMDASTGADTGDTNDRGQCDAYLKCFGALFPEYLDEYMAVYGPTGPAGK